MNLSMERWARWGWLVTTALMGAILVGTAWVGLRRATAAESTLSRGQSQVLLQTVRQQLRATTELPDAARLDSLVTAHRSDGLRYLALLDSVGAPLAQAGQPTAALPHLTAALPPGPPALEKLRSTVRLVGFVFLARPAPPPAPLPVVARPRPLMLVMEFEPVVAEQLAAEAMDTFLLSALVAAALVAAALLFYRLSVRHEAALMRLEQQRRLGALGEMSAVLAHELRNPLASLKGHAQLLAERLAAGSPDRRKAELVVSEAQRLEALTTDLLDFARSGPIDRRVTDPVALLSSCAEEVARGGFAVRVEGSPSTWSLDEVRMRQALTNVLRNARQASPEGTRPEAVVGRDNGTLVFTVRDFGSGLAPGDERRIFSPFFTTRTTGTGLGLAVALRVAEMHGGTITAQNHPDGGAVFRIAIPK